MRLRFVHIVNPYTHNDGDLDPIQRLTLEMLQRAASESNHDVALLSAQFEKDRVVVPPGFLLTKDLTRSLRQISGVETLPEVPVLADILERASAVDCDYVVWSNMDIIPVPQFYDGIAAILESQGCDALIVNRRRVSVSLISHPELLLTETGLPHPGYDCFIIKKQLLPKLKLGNVCVGAPGVGFMLAHNLFLVSEKCVVCADKHLTLHAGYEIVNKWKGREAEAFQVREIKKFIRENRNEFRIENFPGYNLSFFRRHFKWLMNPLFIYPMMFSMDFKKIFDGRNIVRPEKKDSWWQEWKSSRITFD
jgi:hypothetical protein